VRQQIIPGCRARRILICAENYVLSYCVSLGQNGIRRYGSPCIRVYTHLTEIVPKARLEEGTCFMVQRLAR
jgi:hypothetical protein